MIKQMGSGFFNVILSITILVVVWSIAIKIGGYPEYLFPSPSSTLKALIELFTDGSLVTHVLVSMKRFFIGYFLASFIAIVLGLIFGWFKKAWYIAEPIALILKPISPLAWSPFIILWFGIGDAPAIVTIAIAAFFTLLVSTVKAVQNVSKSYMKVASNFGLSKFQTLIKIVLPASFPYLANGLHTALSASWVFLVAGELIGTNSGLGFLINDARQTLRTDLIMAGIVLIGTLGFCLDRLLSYLERLIAAKWGL